MRGRSRADGRDPSEQLFADRQRDDAGPEHERYTGIGDENGWVLDGDEKCSPGEWSTSVDHEAPPPSFGEARPGIGEPSRLNCATCAPSECGLSILKPKT